tara:strand:+ start:1328 stop:1984 length:657 start_codon:yes stop_codon:yes gene_type:complete
MVSVCIIGAGGIGSHLCRSLIPALSRGDLVRELGGVEVVVFDSDIVSDSNLAHQGFSPSSIGMAKVLALESSLSEFGSQWIQLTGRNEDLRREDSLCGFDFVVVCVDSPSARIVVHERGGKWLDLRCRGDCFVALDYRLASDVVSNMTDRWQIGGSCQHEGAIESGNIQFGHLAAATHGCQWVIQELRATSTERALPPIPKAHSITFGTLEKLGPLDE